MFKAKLNTWRKRKKEIKFGSILNSRTRRKSMKTNKKPSYLESYLLITEIRIWL